MPKILEEAQQNLRFATMVGMSAWLQCLQLAISSESPIKCRRSASKAFQLAQLTLAVPVNANQIFARIMVNFQFSLVGML